MSVRGIDTPGRELGDDRLVEREAFRILASRCLFVFFNAFSNVRFYLRTPHDRLLLTLRLLIQQDIVLEAVARFDRIQVSVYLLFDFLMLLLLRQMVIVGT